VYTNTKVNSAFHPSGVGKSSTGLPGWGYCGARLPVSGSGVDKGDMGPSPPIIQTKHNHMFKLHKICQFHQLFFVKIIKIVANRSHLLKLQKI